MKTFSTLLLIGATCANLAAATSSFNTNIGFYFPNARAVDPCEGQADGHFADDPSSCEAYFSCHGGVGTPLMCPPNFFFDEANQMCNYPELVECFGCPPDGVLALPDSSDCTKFILCYGGTQIPMTCADGLLFDEATGQCGLAADVVCNVSCPPGIQAPEDIVFIPSPTECTMYSICFDGVPIEFTCPDGTHFNRATNKCDTEENAACPITPTEAPTTIAGRFGRAQPPIVSTNECPPTGIQFLPNPSDCEFYFICNNGAYTLRQCAAELIFDMLTNKCNVPANSVCIMNATPPTPTAEGEVTDPIDPVDPVDPVDPAEPPTAGTPVPTGGTVPTAPTPPGAENTVPTAPTPAH